MALTPDKIAELDQSWEETKKLRDDRLTSSKEAYDVAQEAVGTAEKGKEARLAGMARDTSQAIASTVAATPAGSGLRLATARGTALERGVQEGVLGAELDSQINAAKKLAADAGATYADEQQMMNKVRQDELQAVPKAIEQADAIAEAEYQKWLGDPNAGPRVAYYSSTVAKLEELLPTLVNPEARKAIQARIDAIKSTVAASGGKFNEM